MIEVRLRFRSEKEKQYFLGQLSDGWGENYVDLKWSGKFDRAKVFDVKPWCVRCEREFVGDCDCEEKLRAAIQAMLSEAPDA